MPPLRRLDIIRSIRGWYRSLRADSADVYWIFRAIFHGVIRYLQGPEHLLGQGLLAPITFLRLPDKPPGFVPFAAD